MTNEPAAPPSPRLQMRIGEILIANEKLTRGQAGEVARVSVERGILFGQAAIALGYVSEEDVAQALRARRVTQLPDGAAAGGAGVAVLKDPASLQAEDMRRLAKTLAIRWFAGPDPHPALSIISPERHEGRTTLAANLACVFAQGGAKTLLIDGDIEHPRAGALFELDEPQALPAAGDRFVEADTFPVRGIHNLAVIPAAEVASAGPEDLLRVHYSQLIAACSHHFDVILVDTAAASASIDYLLAAEATRGAIVVGRQGRSRTRTSVKMLNACDDAGVTIVGGTMLVD